MMCWWLNKGVDGFRMDVINLISKPDELPDGPGGDLSPFCVNGPHVHEYLREMNSEVLSKYDIMTVGECPNLTVDAALDYAGACLLYTSCPAGNRRRRSATARCF